MGLLKLGSLYKKKSKKDASAQPPLPTAASLPKLKPIALELNLDTTTGSGSNHLMSSIVDNNSASPVPQQQKNNSSKPIASGSLFDDIFAELSPNSSAPPQKRDSIDQDISLALNLSHQLQLEQDNNTTSMRGPTKSGNTTMSSNSKKITTSNFLLGDESIYSSYLKNMSALDDSRVDSTFSTSMFDSLLNKGSTNASHHPEEAITTTTITTNATTIPTSPQVSSPTNVVLDSDISDSDEESQNSNDSEELSNNGQHQRMTKGVRPIMERRTQDNRLLVQRKIDNWANRVDPDSNRVESNDSMIQRMKDRHRNQVKLAALRQQQQQQQESMMVGHQHMVSQSYGTPLSSPNVVLPHPGMLMDPAQIYYPTPLNDYSEHSVPTPTVPLPAAFLPNPNHLSLSHKREEGEDTVYHTEGPMPTRHFSTPTARSKPNRSPPIRPPSNSSHASGGSNGSQVQAAPIEISPASSSFTLRSKEDDDVNEDQQEEWVPEKQDLRINTMHPIIEDEAAAEEADAESSDDEERKSVNLRKKKSIKKLRQKQQCDGQPQLGDTSNNRHIRSSRSAPNLKKKQSSKKMAKSANNSRTSSRRNSQEYTAASTPTSEYVATPPPLPTSSSYPIIAPVDDAPYSNSGIMPRSSSHQTFTQQQQWKQQQQRQSLRPMRSEPELPRKSQQQQQQLQHQQLNQEWERLQIHQREQQLKQQYQYNRNSGVPLQTPSVPFVPVYPPMYYPTMPSHMPYSGSSGMDSHAVDAQYNRVSYVNGYNPMMYPQASQQGYYHR